MRLEPKEVVAIKACALRSFGDKVKLILFGSRVDDSKRGGDIDLLIEPADPTRADFSSEGRFRSELEVLIGERKIDILLRRPDDPMTAIQDLALTTGVRLL